MLKWSAVIFMNKQLRGSLSLFGAVIIWGSAFIAQSVGMELIGPFTFQAIRCGLAVLFLVPLSFVFDHKPGAVKRWLDPKLWKSGIVCGLALFAAASLQQVGLVYTDAGKAGFLTAMYIVLVPILGLFLGQKPPKSAWFSVALAVVGLYLLSCMGVSQINIGDILLAGCALAYAVQITLIDRCAGELDGVRLNCVQSLVVTVLSVPFMAFTETVDMGNILACWLPLCYAGIASMGIAYSLQIIGQKHLEPTTASLIMSLESVIAALCGWLILKETMTIWELLGCALVFSAVIISQLPGKSDKR
ncbi:MAG: DMT family transporter [Oscillospiraceae bacterium]|nr:DMT family transporter [Oscillospiraceae bacterium]